MAWGEAADVDFVFGLARNARLVREIAPELATAAAQHAATGAAARVFKDFAYQTRDSWTRARRVIGEGGAAAGESQ